MKAEYGDMVYTVDMGDTIQGEPMTYYYAFNADDLGVADPAIRALRTIGYDMWLLGNHEFNYGINILTRQIKEAVAPATETENQLVLVDANYLDADTNNDETKSWDCVENIVPYVIKDFDGVKVAIIGLSTPNIPNWDGPANWKGFYFESIYETYRHYEAEMVEKADMIVVMAHCGLNSEMADASYDSVRYLVEHTNTIDFAFSGHAHGRAVNDITNSDGEIVKVLQPGTKAALISQVKVSYNKETGKYTIDAQNVNMANRALDEETVELLQPYEDYVWQNYMLQRIGEATADFPAANLGTKPSAFMDLINQVQIGGAYDVGGVNTPDDPTNDTPAQLSISAPLTSGSNANLISNGDIFLGDLFALYRYENWFYQLTMSGKEIRTWLEYSATKLNYNSSTGNVSVGMLTYYDVIYGEGFSYVLDPARPEGERVVSMTYNDVEIKDDEEFTIVMNNYRFTGGGDYVKYCNEHGCDLSDLESRIIYSTQYDMIQGEDLGQARALLEAYIREKGSITPEVTSEWEVTPNWEGSTTDPEPEPATASYVKVTEAPTDYSGTYLFTYDDGSGTVKVFSGVDAEGNYITTTATDGTIATGNSEVDALVVTIEATEGGYFLKVGGQYMGGGTSGKNSLSLGDAGILNTVTFTDGTALFLSNSLTLRFNTNTKNGNRFRYYKDNTGNNAFPGITLYKLTEG